MHCLFTLSLSLLFFPQYILHIFYFTDASLSGRVCSEYLKPHHPLLPRPTCPSCSMWRSRTLEPQFWAPLMSSACWDITAMSPSWSKVGLLEILFQLQNFVLRREWCINVLTFFPLVSVISINQVRLSKPTWPFWLPAASTFVTSSAAPPRASSSCPPQSHLLASSRSSLSATQGS